jgi:hypothetical protein
MPINPAAAIGPVAVELAAVEPAEVEPAIVEPDIVELRLYALNNPLRRDDLRANPLWPLNNTPGFLGERM